MRFSYAESMTDPSFYLPLAQAAEDAGYHSFVVPDSIAYPQESETRYPFNPDGSREFLEDKPFLEPFSLIPALGAVTTKLRFVTFVVKLPIRHPVLVAKQVTSTAVLTDNRLLLGVGTSPWPEDYVVCDVPWEG
ncbi:MAG: LLM class flavin-dependent oxidoreductase, partial [Gemmatimonadales bacterium]